MFSDAIRNEIVKDIRSNFAGYKGGLNNNMLLNMISVFEQFIAYPDEHDDFAGYHKVEDIITAYYDEGSFNSVIVEEALSQFLNFEPFLRKLCYMVDKKAYTKTPVKTATCNMLVSLGLYEAKERSNGTIYHDVISFGEHFNDTVLEECLAQAYDMRIDTAHKWSDFGRTERSSYVANVMSVCIYICHRFRTTIKNRCEVLQQVTIDLPGICKQFVREYEQEMAGGFRYVPMRWYHEQTEEFLSSNIQDLYDPATNTIRIEFSGDAGCGKTTIAKHLAYEDAKRYLHYIKHEKDSTVQIPKVPIFIELKTISTVESVISYISRSILKCSESETQQLLDAGIFTLYLDGVNEMISAHDIKRTFILSVQKLLQNSKGVSVISTDRGAYDFTLHDQLNVYHPCQPTNAEILNFVNVVTQGKENASTIHATIKSWLEENEDRHKRFNTPFKINRLIEIVSCGKELSDDEHTYLHTFVTAILERERTEKMDYRAEPGRLDMILCLVAKQFRNAEDVVPYAHYTKFFANAIRELCLDMDSVSCAKLAVQLGFVTAHNQETMFSFADEHLYDYFKNLA